MPFTETLSLNLIFACTGLAVLLLLLAGFIRRLKSHERPHARRIMSKREQRMYFMLEKALPEFIILSQVCFSALLTARSYAVRARFNRKYTDFVICDRNMNVIAIIELDDWSHKKKQAQDAARDKMLARAGYSVLRYNEIPSPEAIRSDIL